MNRQPWHFIVVRDRETLRKLGASASSGPYIAQAPLAIVVATDRSRFAVSDASRAIQSMMLAAWADGVGSNWVGFGGLDGVKALLGIPAPWDEARNSARRCGRSPTSSDTAARSSDATASPARSR